MASVLQSVAMTAKTFTSGSSGTASGTFGSNVTPGSLVGVSFLVADAVAAETITGVTLAGTSDVFALATSENNAQTPNVYTYVDPDSAGGQKTVDVALAFGGTASAADGVGFLGWMWEIAGMVTSSPVDKTAPGGSADGATSWSSGSTPTLSQANEVALGAAGFLPVDGATQTITPPASGGWTNQTLQSGTVELGGDTYHIYFQAGINLLAATTAIAYAGTNSDANSYYAACLATLKEAAAAAANCALLAAIGLP